MKGTQKQPHVMGRIKIFPLCSTVSFNSEVKAWSIPEASLEGTFWTQHNLHMRFVAEKQDCFEEHPERDECRKTPNTRKSTRVSMV